MTKRIACIGEAMIELAMTGDTAQVGVAGDTLNTAIYLHRAAPGFQVDYITRLGDDPFSHQIRSFIAAAGVGAEQIEMVPNASPGLYAIATKDGERSFTYWRSTSAARSLFANHDFSVLSDYDALYLSGITLAILPQTVRLALVNWLEQSDIQLIYDSNYRPRLWDSVENARSITTALWHRTDLALPSIDDEMALFDETEAQTTARALTFKDGALKRGALGPLSLGSDINQTYPAAANVIDTTAAGDSFNGAYIAARLSGAPQADALRAGHDCAARVIQYRGAIIPE